ncbi:MAG TPA: 16S rRNA (guanine(527)-N(7))-methyltransferase RsmG [Alphaproteobacteria bacterium]
MSRPAAYTRAQFAADVLVGWPDDVSRETLDRLGRYEALLRKWQVRINLVGPGTLNDVWRRHFLDSAQLFPLIPGPAATLIDLGSGAGFPGLVLAILAGAVRPGLAVHLVESDARKAAFLIEAVRETGAAAKVHTARVEAMAGRLPPADVVTARALAPLGTLLALAHPLMAPGGMCLLLKGARAEAEIEAARLDWRFRLDRRTSRSDPDGAVLIVADIAPAR